MIRDSKNHAKGMALVATVVLVVSASSAVAQTSAPKKAAPRAAVPAAKPAPTKSTATKPPAAPAQPAGKPPVAEPSSAERAAREQILDSEEWRDMLAQFDQWLTKQTLYDSEQVALFRRRLAVGIKRMSAAQLQRFMAEMHTRLEVLTSQHAIDAQEYLAETLSVSSQAYAKKVREQLPDILSMNAAQIDHKLAGITTKRAATAKMQKTFEDGRQRMVASNEALTRARRSEQAAEAADRASSYSSQSNFTPAADYYPNYYDAFDTGWDGYAGVTLPLGGDRF